MKEFFLGKLDMRALPHELFMVVGSLSFILMGLVVVIIITRMKRWKWLWNEWLTSVDPKKIGIMYFIAALLMLIRGGLDAIMIWLQQALSSGDSHGYLSSDHFQQIFTAHGNIMVFFVAMAFIFGLINYIVPLQIGARDLASPLMNTLGFWLFIGGIIMVNMFFFLGGEYAATGWLAAAPLNSTQFSPGVGVDYWVWSLMISGIGTTMGAINFIMTILKMRAPGMTLKKMPLFTWGSLCSMVMAVTVFPLLTMTLFLVFFDRSLGTHFFTTMGGGDPMLYTNLIWMWGHPEVYILVLPVYGLFSEVVAVFSRKKIFSYMSSVYGMIAVSVLALSVWLHHFFTMGAGANVNAFFGIMTTVIAIPTTALMFNWIATMYKGRIRLETPMLWFLGFVAVFTLGGITGVMLAVPPLDFQLHNSLFLVAHFHSTVIGGVLFGIFSAFGYWFPKFTGFRLNERLGRYAFWCWIIGFCMSFLPMYVLGFMGASRRLDHYEASTGWQPLFIMMLLGGIVIMAGVALQIVQIIASFMQKKQLRVGNNPWGGSSLEWTTPSAPPIYNFVTIPNMQESESKHQLRQNNSTKVVYEDIHMPKPTAVGIYISAYATAASFAFVWHIYWLAAVSIVGIVITFIKRAFDEDSEYVFPAKEVKKIEEARQASAALEGSIPEHNTDIDMGLREFISIVYRFLIDIVKNKRWRSW